MSWEDVFLSCNQLFFLHFFYFYYALLFKRLSFILRWLQSYLLCICGLRNRCSMATKIKQTKSTEQSKSKWNRYKGKISIVENKRYTYSLVFLSVCNAKNLWERYFTLMLLATGNSRITLLLALSCLTVLVQLKCLTPGLLELTFH